jgi:hydroxyacylglutathione hydrolase
MSATLVIRPVPCLKDNYAYVVNAPGSRVAYVVDPSEPEPVAAALAAAGLELAGILATHHHPDHVGGIAGLLATRGAGGGIGGAPVWVAGHARDRGRIPHQSIEVDAPTGTFVESGVAGVELAGARIVAMHIPGHTRAAIAWGLVPAAGGPPSDVFTGDTLFGAGCGRLFEGTPAEMFASLTALTAPLPGDTRLWFGHEYTAGNLRFAATVEPQNSDIAARQAAAGARTTPTTVALERATNPFVRAGSVDELARRRTAKDNF